MHLAGTALAAFIACQVHLLHVVDDVGEGEVQLQMEWRGRFWFTIKLDLKPCLHSLRRSVKLCPKPP